MKFRTSGSKSVKYRQNNPRILISKERMPTDMMTSSNGNIFRVTGPLCGEFTGPGDFPAQRAVTRSFDVFFDLRPINDWVNNRESGDLRRHRGHYDVSVIIQLYAPGAVSISHWDRDKMAAIFQTTFSSAFFWKKMYKFRLRFHWSLLPRIQLSIFQRWFG